MLKKREDIFNILIAGIFSIFQMICFFGSADILCGKEEKNSFERGDRPAPKNEIDIRIAKNLEKKGLTPAPICSDAVFLRRIHIDLLGRLPLAKEVMEFLNDQDPEKRSKMIDRLLDSDRFVDYQTMRWADLLRVKSEFPINLWPNGAAVYHRWIQAAVRENLPYDQFVYTLLTSSGSNFRCGPANFYRAIQMRDANTIAEAAGSVFLGIQVDDLPEKEQAQFSKFFSRVAYKGSAQWKEEIVYWDSTPLESPDLVYPDGSKGKIDGYQDPRVLFADWLVRPENELFRKNIVNRVWAWLFGKGLVHPEDDFRKENPSVCPGLLEYLAQELLTAKFDLRHIYRIILNSNTYQRSFLMKKYDPDAEKYFAVYPVRRINAEVLQDIFIQLFKLQITYMSEVPEPYSFLPSQLQTIEIADSGITNSFLEMFGRATRDTGTDVDRNNDITGAQELFFLNSNEVNKWVRRFAENLTGWKRQNQGKRPYSDGRNENRGNGIHPSVLWLSILSRFPTKEEKELFDEDFKKTGSKMPMLEDYIWTLINSKEFLCQH
ncbi:MAG: DUF1553 domain-containing protein [Planctomycetia bacterium]|nr:DUF1553 domain-containing protein [Planctomycetia bacterium]